jgi:hypothetical protein
MIWFLRNRIKHAPGVRVFLMWTAAMICAFTFLNGFKAPNYLIYLIPFYDVVLAAWLVSLWSRARDSKYVAVCLALAFAVIQTSTSIQHIRADEYHRDFEPAVRDIHNYRAAGKTIVASSALGFGVGFHAFRDDARLGMYSGLNPDVIVVDRYYVLMARIFEKEEPKVYSHVVTALTSDYRLSRNHGSFWIFERIDDRPASPVPREHFAETVEGVTGRKRLRAALQGTDGSLDPVAAELLR